MPPKNPEPGLNARTKLTHKISIPPPDLLDYAPTPKLPSPMSAEMVARVAAERERERMVRDEREGVVRGNVVRMRVGAVQSNGAGVGDGAVAGRAAEGVSRGENAGADLGTGRESDPNRPRCVEFGGKVNIGEPGRTAKRRRTTDLSHPYHDKSVEVGVGTKTNTTDQIDAETETLRHGGKEDGMILAGQESEGERERKRMQLERFRVTGDTGVWMGNGIGFRR